MIRPTESQQPGTSALSPGDLDALRYARDLLEHPGLAAKLTHLLGAPIERGFDLLPARWSDKVNRAAERSLRAALDFALLTLDDRAAAHSSNTFHKLGIAATGAAGGAFGLAALPIELPVSTTVMLRSIADIARSEGEPIKQVETRLACLEVFALGGRTRDDDAAETGYFAVRAALAGAVTEAARHIARHGAAERVAPVIVKLISKLASRFGVVVSQKAAAQAVPLIGAAGGAIVNTIFIDHFQDIARGHFIIRRLERAYGAETVRAAYEGC